MVEALASNDWNEWRTSTSVPQGIHLTQEAINRTIEQFRERGNGLLARELTSLLSPGEIYRYVNMPPYQYAQPVITDEEGES